MKKQSFDNTSVDVANCFLVYGVRGTGKTTVLHSAKLALCNTDSSSTNKFFPEEPHEGSEVAKKAVIKLIEKHIVWLPILDLEPLHANTNLLTTVLTHVRNALEQTNCGKKGTGHTSIFEESTGSARQQFSQLIQDATLIWEEIHEIDTRGIVSRQVAAADFYAKFRENFQNAMKALSEQLGQVHGSADSGCSIVLPIDNIDRSTEHLRAIVKLAQLVSHNRLWLVLAGDRQDIESFLERAYWKELISNSGNADARGKNNEDGEDEALVMARRQAAASYQKL
jgi:Cdc6-like AAA superfamily ATPase